MAELAQHIKASGAAARLFAFLYGETLIVCNDAPIDPRKEALLIEFDRYTQKRHFRYFPRHSRLHNSKGSIHLLMGSKGLINFST